MEIRVSNVPMAPTSTASTAVIKTGTWRNLRPIIEDKTGPCMGACPAHNRIPVFMLQFSQGNMEDAARTIFSRNPFPAITGRVCPHQCEVGCNRKRVEGAVSIRAVERFIGDEFLDLKAEPPSFETLRSVGIVGSGPAGLTAAYYLRRFGHEVTVYEKSEHLGGILREGIPEYRLPHEVVDKEVEALKRMGIRFRTRFEVGKDVEFDDLVHSHDAVFVATGAHKEIPMKIAGEECVYSGFKFLQEVSNGLRKVPWKNVAVVGGGNVAMDVARTLLRLGARPTVLYRRTRKEMPAIREEIERAEKDAIPIEYLTAPVEVRPSGDRFIVKCVRMKLGKPDKSGRPAPEPIAGSEYEIEVDRLVRATGERADTALFPKDLLDDHGWLKAEARTGATPNSRVFAGGDLVTGPATVVEAIAWGRTVAAAMVEFLRASAADDAALGGAIAGGISRQIAGAPSDLTEKKPPTVPFKSIRLTYFTREDRTTQPEISVAARVQSFDEEVLDWTLEQARREALRCYDCGICNSCGNCWTFCPDVSILWINGKPVVDLDHCKGCGICAMECPRGVITMVDETLFA